MDPNIAVWGWSCPRQHLNICKNLDEQAFHCSPIAQGSAPYLFQLIWFDHIPQILYQLNCCQHYYSAVKREEKYSHWCAWLKLIILGAWNSYDPSNTKWQSYSWHFVSTHLKWEQYFFASTPPSLIKHAPTIKTPNISIKKATSFSAWNPCMRFYWFLSLLS